VRDAPDALEELDVLLRRDGVVPEAEEDCNDNDAKVDSVEDVSAEETGNPT